MVLFHPNSVVIKNPQKWQPPRPNVSSRNAVTYGVAKELARIISPLVGQSPHHIKNTQHFVEQIKSLKMQNGECMVSYNVKALLTSVPVDSAISIIKSKLLKNPLLSYRTSKSTPQIITQLEFCLKTTYLFQGKYFEQVHSAAMGSPFSPSIANLFMEEFEPKAISSAPQSI